MTPDLALVADPDPVAADVEPVAPMPDPAPATFNPTTSYSVAEFKAIVADRVDQVIGRRIDKLQRKHERELEATKREAATAAAIATAARLNARIAALEDDLDTLRVGAEDRHRHAVARRLRGRL